MKYLHVNIFVYVIPAIVIAAIAGCGNDDSLPNSGDIWFDAGIVQQMYAGQIRMEAVEAGKSEADMSCGAVLPLAKKSLSDSGSGTVAQIMYKLCNNAGLKFQKEIRCEADRLQVLCR